jgi:hypothetical protein
MIRRVDTTRPYPAPLRDTFHLDASWLASRVAESPALLGVTTGAAIFERTVPRAGSDQFAVLLFDPADGLRHVVEIQLGAADENQLIRALELWAVERTRSNVDHQVAIAAEHIPARVARSAALARAIAPIDVVELHAEPTGNAVTVHGMAVETPSGADPDNELAFALRLRTFLGQLDPADPLRGRLVGPPPGTL